MDTRSSTPEPPPQDLWSSILNSVSSSRSTPSKQIIVLGQPSTGKSTVAAALLQKPIPDHAQLTDFALGYDYADIRDDADEDTLARLSVYTVPSSNTAYTSLLPHFLPPRASLPDTLAVIVLDWTRPWTFVEELQSWLQWLDTWVAGDNSRELQIAREESRERLQSHLQHYTEPTADPIPATSALSSTVLPLGSGTLTQNSAGIPIIVVCTKADLIDVGHDLVGGASGMGGMVKGKGGEWEEQTDTIMQILRTICLKYGAALFYTTQLATTQQILRQYALHMLFVPPAPSPIISSADAAAPVRNPFPFQHPPNVLDRDRIVVPAGWDSWGKINVVMEGKFSPQEWGEAWDRDLEADSEEVEGAKTMYIVLVPDQGSKPPPLPPFNSPVPEQAFLSKNFDENSKKPHRDPLGVFRNAGDLEGAAAGIVGPMGNSSFGLPTVIQALSEMEGSTKGSLGASTGRAGGGRPAPLASSGNPVGRPGASPTPAAASPSPTGSGSGQTQHQVLQDFFNSLLSNKGGSSTARGNPKTNGAPSTTEEAT